MTDSLARRFAEFAFVTAARAPEWATATPGELDDFIRQLTAQIGSSLDGADLAVWVDGEPVRSATYIC
ncbi:hypothetical protein [Kitasatospora acidiphila]|uniref:hypothetical protein n=1 Tax=Kitasatospora acidiphila TaxID=2567942 RepID=UPI0015F078F5|nr:hypothetical protein [Kitasatospora acidiphila]